MCVKKKLFHINNIYNKINIFNKSVVNKLCDKKFEIMGLF